MTIIYIHNYIHALKANYLIEVFVAITMYMHRLVGINPVGLIATNTDTE